MSESRQLIEEHELTEVKPSMSRNPGSHALDVMLEQLKGEEPTPQTEPAAPAAASETSSVSEMLKKTEETIESVTETATSPEISTLNEKVLHLKRKYKRLLQTKTPDFKNREYNLYKTFSSPKKGPAEQALYSTTSEVEAVVTDLSEVNEAVSSITGDLSDTVNKLLTFATNGEESVNLAAETCPIRLKDITDRVPKALQNTFRASRVLRYSPVMFHNQKQHALHCCKRMMGISLTLQKEFGRFLVNLPPTSDDDDLEQLRTHLNLSLDALNVILYALDDGMTKLCALNVLATGEVSQEERSVMNVSENLNVQSVDEDIFLHPGRHRSNSLRNGIERMLTTQASIFVFIVLVVVTLVLVVVLIVIEIELANLKSSLNNTS
ncbi:hypothetical protein C0J52_08517 [Blattella germanica]|nr:hypothetical protein C0J52_08517 [Blattella germanica]